MEIQNAYEQIRKANLVAGQITKDVEKGLEGIKAQFDIIQEELDETVRAFDNQDPIELLDGSIDTFVTVCGLLQKLEGVGVNVNEALARVVANNLTKFPKTNIARRKPELKPEGTKVYESPYGYTAYLRDDGKYRKPTNYVPVDLKGCIDEKLFGEVVEVQDA